MRQKAPVKAVPAMRQKAPVKEAPTIRQRRRMKAVQLKGFLKMR